jgi:hypothetical protein
VNEIIKIDHQSSCLFPASAESAHRYPLRLFSPDRRGRIVVALKGALRVLMPQKHLVLLHILDLRILRYAFLVVHIVLLNTLDHSMRTSGRNGLFNLRCSSKLQSILARKG